MIPDNPRSKGHFLLDGEESCRLRFRKLVPGDFGAWLPFYLDPESTRFWKAPPMEPRQACRVHFNRIFERYEKGLGGMNALILKDTGALVGQCGLLVQEVDGIEELEVGYSVLTPYRRSGFATEAARTCMVYAFRNHLTPSLISIIHVDNAPSQGVAQKNGLHPEKTTIYKDNPVVIYRITRGEYFR